MGITETIPQDIRDLYEIHEWRHASAILEQDFKGELNDIFEMLRQFKLYKSHIITGGGRKSSVSSSLDDFLYSKGWEEKKFDTAIRIDNAELVSPTHKIDCFKNRVALEIEWNNKDPFFDRDLNNFRLLFDLRAVSVGVIITRCDELQEIFDELGRGGSYGTSTTHMSKLLPRINGGGGAGCPILVFGITKGLFIDDIPRPVNNEKTGKSDEEEYREYDE
ncbi:MAG: BglII/BstYI family type II restriction endonuclease [Bacteroidia bacterium]